MSQSDKSTTTDEPIRITHEEAMSAKVDDFLNRQRSLTGDVGITKERTRTVWYLQNWFVFGLAGALAAFAVWAFTEPYIDDLFYLQGPIENLNLQAALPSTGDLPSNGDASELSGLGWIDVNGHKIWLWQGVQEYSDGEAVPLQANELRQGREVGIYLEYVSTLVNDIALGVYVILNPVSPPPEKATLSLRELDRRDSLFGMLVFPLIAGAIGLAVGAAEGLVCRLIRRALLGGLVGLLVGLVGGFVSHLFGGLLYASVNSVVMRQVSEAGQFSSFAFFLQIIGRGGSWALIGLAMGLGQGIALRSKRLLIYGFLGGVVGGLLGGLFFDPIYFLIQGEATPSAHLSRMIGFTLIGLSVGVMIGVVQLLARDAWLRMTEGPLAGKEFLFFKDTMTIGASPKCEIYLFNDPQVVSRHATLRTIGDDCEIQSLSREKPVIVNDRAVQRSRLRHGDRITIGRTSFVFQTRQA
ncbi:MAG: FHA domain-containing protein [bacterium]